MTSSAPLRMLNALAMAWRPSQRLATLDAERLVAAAQRKTGLSDLGDPWFHEALSAIVDSVNREGKLTPFGRYAFEQSLKQNLCSRLLVNHAVKHYPEVLQQEIRRPVFITGLYRSGTTLLHKMLAGHPDLRAPLYWELRRPCPTPDPRTAKASRTIRTVRFETAFHRFLAPGFFAAHHFEAETPEECLHLFDTSCAGTTPFFITQATSCAWWLLDHDMGHAYAFFKTQLQLLNWLRPGPRWVLKWPFHLWHLDTLLDTFPDATVVHLHRDPREAIPSLCNLAAMARLPFSDSVDGRSSGQFWLDLCAAGLDRGLRARASFDPDRLVDVRFADLKKDPLSAIRRLRSSLDLEPSDEWSESLERSARTPKHHGATHHSYDAQTFGLEVDEIRERTSRYIQDFDLA